MTRQGCLRHLSENVNFQTSKASCDSHRFSPLGSSHILRSEQQMETRWVQTAVCGRGTCCAECLMVSTVASKRQSLPSKCPSTSKMTRDACFWLKKTRKIKNYVLFSSGEQSTWCTAAPRNRGLEPPRGCHVPEFLEGLWLLVSWSGFTHGDLDFATPGTHSAGNRSREYCTAL